MTALTIEQLSTGGVEGSGTFDVLMRAFKAHLEQEHTLGRIRGPEFSTVYLGALDQAMQTGLAFLLQSEKQAKELELLDKQIAQAEAQTQLIFQQRANLISEGQNIPKQGLVLDAQKGQIESQTQINTQQKLNLAAEKSRIDQQTGLISVQAANAVLEGKVLVAQECKLKAEFDGITANTLKSNQELALLTQKVITEKAQTQSIGVDPDSVVGRQKGLYVAQTNGFQRDAEQKAAKLMVDTWAVRRTTDEGTVADATNMLNDATIGRAVNKMLTGVAA